MMGRKRKEIVMVCDTEGELDLKSNVHFLHIPNSDKPVKIYSLTGKIVVVKKGSVK
jgi:hypothetical protein